MEQFDHLCSGAYLRCQAPGTQGLAPCAGGRRRHRRSQVALPVVAHAQLLNGDRARPWAPFSYFFYCAYAWLPVSVCLHLCRFLLWPRVAAMTYAHGSVSATFLEAASICGCLCCACGSLHRGYPTDPPNIRAMAACCRHVPGSEDARRAFSRGHLAGWEG